MMAVGPGARAGYLRRVVTIRSARLADEADLSRLDFETTWMFSTIRAVPTEPRPFFGADTAPEDVLVAELDGAVVGYVRLVHPTPFPASAHVLMIAGLGVDPAFGRRGIGRALVLGVLDVARERGVRRVTLRVLGPNEGARALYESCGFVVEGVQRGEFHLDGRDIDDWFLAYQVT
jgi:ribosomal protein S18 acetylase RimI-like enzyme